MLVLHHLLLLHAQIKSGPGGDWEGDGEKKEDVEREEDGGG